MKITSLLTDHAVLQELGERIARVRIERNLTQAALAVQAGVSKRTVERLEAGQVATQLSGFLRICRAVGILERLELLLPEPVPGPIELLRQQGRRRQRAARRGTAAPADKKWTWGEPS